MDKDTLERLIATQELLMDVTANIEAIKKALYKAKVTDPKTLGASFKIIRLEMSASPAGKGLEVARAALKSLKDIS